MRPLWPGSIPTILPASGRFGSDVAARARRVGMAGTGAVDVAKVETEVEVDSVTVLVEPAELEVEVDDAAVLVEAAELAQAMHSRAIATEAAAQ